MLNRCLKPKHCASYQSLRGWRRGGRCLGLQLLQRFEALQQGGAGLVVFEQPDEVVHLGRRNVLGRPCG
jgi:hypothetical protein